MLAVLNDASALSEQRTLLAQLREDLGLPHVGVMGWCLGAVRVHPLCPGCTLTNVISIYPTIPAEPTNEQSYDVTNGSNCWVIPGATPSDIGVPLRDPGHSRIGPRISPCPSGAPAQFPAPIVDHMSA